MMKYSWVAICLIALTHIAQAQKGLNGMLIGPDGKAISYALLGIEGTKIGTLTDEGGSFSLDIPKSYHDQKLFFQAPGFKTEGFRIDSLYLVKKVVVRLKEDVRKLRSVQVSPGIKPTKKTKGSKGLVFGSMAISHSPNTAFGVRVSLPEEAQLEDIMFHVQNDKVMRFKVRPFVYRYANGVIQASQNLISENSTFSFEAKKGWLKIELEEQGPVLEGEFIIGVHWLEIESDGSLPMATMSLSAFGGRRSFESQGFRDLRPYKGMGAFSIKAIFTYYK